MTKEEYLEEKRILDDQIQITTADIERVRKELQKIPSKADLENLEQMAANILNVLGDNLDISPQEKRQVMQMLNLKVLMSLNGRVRLEGWFREDDGLLSTPLSR